MPTVVAGQMRVACEAGARIGQLLDRRDVDAEVVAMQQDLPKPVEEVLPAIPARDAPAVAHRQDDLPPGVEELLGELDTRLAGADDEHAAGRQVLRTAIVVRVDLDDPRRHRGTGRRDPRMVEGTRGQDDVAGDERARRRAEPELGGARLLQGAELLHADPGPHLCTHDRRVRGRPRDDLLAAEEAAGVGAVVGEPG